jgi:hypothetical protein
MPPGRPRFPTAPMAVSLLLTTPGPPRPDPHHHVALWPVGTSDWEQRGPWPTGSARAHRPCSPLWGLLGRICTFAWRRGRPGALAHAALPAWCCDRPGALACSTPARRFGALSAESTPRLSMETTRGGEPREWR